MRSHLPTMPSAGIWTYQVPNWTQSLWFATGWKNQIAALRVKGIWNDLANKLKQMYISVTDDDLLLVEGDEERLMGRLQQKLGMTPHEIRRLIASLQEITSTAGPFVPPA